MTTLPVNIVLIVVFGISLILINVFILLKLIKTKDNKSFWSFWAPLIILILLISVPVSIVLDGHVFCKSKIKKKLAKHEFVLNEKFVVTSNRSARFIDPFYQFTIQVSEKDKNNIVNKLLSNKNTIENPEKMYDIRYDKPKDIDTVYTVSFEDEIQVEYQCFETNSEGERPKLIVINVWKKQNQLNYYERR